MSSATPPLGVADDATFWPWFSSPALAAWPDRPRTVVVLPLAGLADWGLGHPLDAEETVLLHVLAEASRRRPPDRRLLVLPPLRFVAGPAPGCAFALDPPVAHAQVAEVAGSVGAAGFRRIVLLNASPWNEELCAVAARDLRVGRGLHMFCINLGSIGLDFHPVRSRDRRRVQTLVTALTGRSPEAPPPGAPPPPRWGDETVTPLAGPAVELEPARIDGAATLAAAADRLAALLGEVGARDGLRADGRIDWP
jgi:creatinine amidohydrolase